MTVEERLLARWQAAGVLPADTAAAIRAYERDRGEGGSRQWQVLVALILGSMLLGAGVLLFVAAHWDGVAPGGRLALVLAMLLFFHGLAVAARQRFSGFATALHAVGTVSAGAAIALVGQIFNMEEHWPAAVLLWALCAGAGWWLLRDQFQEVLTLLLVPAWVLCEWGERTAHYTGTGVYEERMVLVMGVVYLTAWLRSRRHVVFGVLFAVGAVATAVATGLLTEGAWRSAWYESSWGFVPLPYRVAAFAVMGAVVALAVWRQRWTAVPAALAVVLGLALPWLQTHTTHTVTGGGAWTGTEPNVAAYALLGTAALGLVAWGVRMAATALVNFGVVAFGLTVLWFYSSNVMDKLGRSLGLITLGVLFLAGGWALEQARRRLVSGLERAL